MAWTERYAPKFERDLTWSRQKITELRSYFGTSSGKNVVVCGPSGCGKFSALSILIPEASMRYLNCIDASYEECMEFLQRALVDPSASFYVLRELPPRDLVSFLLLSRRSTIVIIHTIHSTHSEKHHMSQWLPDALRRSRIIRVPPATKAAIKRRLETIFPLAMRKGPVVERISHNCNGDIRHAILQLQWEVLSDEEEGNVLDSCRDSCVDVAHAAARILTQRYTLDEALQEFTQSQSSLMMFIISNAYKYFSGDQMFELAMMYREFSHSVEKQLLSDPSVALKILYHAYRVIQKNVCAPPHFEPLHSLPYVPHQRPIREGKKRFASCTAGDEGDVETVPRKFHVAEMLASQSLSARSVWSPTSLDNSWACELSLGSQVCIRKVQNPISESVSEDVDTKRKVQVSPWTREKTNVQRSHKTRFICQQSQQKTVVSASFASLVRSYREGFDGLVELRPNVFIGSPLPLSAEAIEDA